MTEQFRSLLNDATGAYAHARIALNVHRERFARERANQGGSYDPLEVNSGPFRATSVGCKVVPGGV